MVRRRPRTMRIGRGFRVVDGVTYGPAHTSPPRRPPRDRGGLARMAQEADLRGPDAAAFKDAVRNYRETSIDRWLGRLGLEEALSALEPFERLAFRDRFAKAAALTTFDRWGDLQVGRDTETGEEWLLTCRVHFRWVPDVVAPAALNEGR